MTRPEPRAGQGQAWLVDLPGGRAIAAAWGEIEFVPFADGSIRIDAIRPADASVDLVELITRAMTAIGRHLAPGHQLH